jgi:hypothetical protein
MDDAFSLIAADMPRPRRISPFGVRVAVAVMTAVMLLVSFAMFVTGQQRAADERRSAMVAQQAAERQEEARAAAVAAASLTAIQPEQGSVDRLLDSRARDAARGAITSAEQLAATMSLDRLLPDALASLNHHVLFIEGPSTGPSVVSVFARPTGWAAAVQGSANACYWVALASGGRVRYGDGSPCTGMAALAADRRSW